MALFNEVLVGRQQNLLTRLFQMVGASPAPVLSPEIQPGLDVGTRQDELDALQGIRHARCALVQFGDGALFPRVGLQNLTGSGLLVIIYQVELTLVAAATTVIFGMERRSTALTPSPSNGGNRHTDYRNDRSTNYSLGDSLGPSGRAGGSVDQLGVNSTVMSWYPLAATRQFLIVDGPIVLPPSSAVCFAADSAAVTTGVYANFRYAYRNANQAELEAGL